MGRTQDLLRKGMLGALIFLAGITATQAASAPLPGMNMAGGEFGTQTSTFNSGYRYPTPQELDPFIARGFKLFRVPFLAARLIKGDGRERTFEPRDHAALLSLVQYTARRDVKIVLDMHDYGFDRQGRMIGLNAFARQMFADDWGFLAQNFRGHPHVMFGLMNEPHDQNAVAWAMAANDAIASIRRAGACQTILMPGTAWSSAQKWSDSGNATAMNMLSDPLRNVIFEVHQYLDADGSGKSASVTPGSGRTRLVNFTEWARRHHVRGFLGEFGFAGTPEAMNEGRDLLSYIHANADVWAGWSYWAAGAWWGDYMFSVEPKNGMERPQMSVLLEAMQSTRNTLMASNLDSSGGCALLSFNLER